MKQANINVVYAGVLHVGHCVLICRKSGMLIDIILSECLIHKTLCTSQLCVMPLAAKNSVSQQTLLTLPQTLVLCSMQVPNLAMAVEYGG